MVCSNLNLGNVTATFSSPLLESTAAGGQQLSTSAPRQPSCCLSLATQAGGRGDRRCRATPTLRRSDRPRWQTRTSLSVASLALSWWSHHRGGSPHPLSSLHQICFSN